MDNNLDNVDIDKILPNDELKYYIETFLISDREFIKDVDLSLCDGKMKNMDFDDRKRYFDFNIGNGARTYILKLLTLKHLSKILLHNVEYFIDIYWKDRLEKINFNIKECYKMEKKLKNKELKKIIDEVCKFETISMSTIHRYFKLSLHKTAEIFDILLEKKIIERSERKNVGYFILDKKQLSKNLKKLV